MILNARRMIDAAECLVLPAFAEKIDQKADV
jgi:hypothetical protein